jgi:hypothetical protein
MILSFQPAKQTDPVGRAMADKPDVPAALGLLWKRSIAIPVSLASSYDGKFVASVDMQGGICCFGPDGQPVWQIALPGVDRVVLGPDGSAVAYSYLNILNTTAYVIGSDGKLRWKQEVTGAIWSVDASNTPGVFAIGTGERYCYRYTITKRSHRYKRWRLPGAPCTLSFTPDGKSLLCGTWQEAGVSSYSLDGRQIACRPGKGDRLYTLGVAAKGNRVLVTSAPNRDVPEATLQLKDVSLNDLWTQEFSVRKLVSDISTSGDYVAVGFERPIAYKDKQVMENRIALYDRNGQMLWEKGGVFGKWGLIQVTASDHLLVRDDSAYIYSLSRAGTVLLRRKLPAAIRMFAKVPSRSKVVVYCGDGQLMLLDVR